MRLRMRAPSPAMAVALVALLAALGGTAVAAGVVPRARLADNALRLQGKTLKQVTALAGATTVTAKTEKLDLSAKQSKSLTLQCDPGTSAVGVGHDGALVFTTSRPVSASAWEVTVTNALSTGQTAALYVVCVA